MATRATDSWPLFGLQVRTDEVSLRYPDDDDLLELVELAARGIHDPAVMPFSVPWSREPVPALQRKALQFHWQSRADTGPDTFRVSFVIEVDGAIAGSTEAFASGFTTLRQFETGSWLGREFQGRGLGAAMRRATLAFGFDGLDAVRSMTGAWDDNPASLGVTRKLGYAEQGYRWADREGAPARLLGFEMEREQYERIKPHRVEFIGLDPVRDFFDLPPRVHTVSDTPEDGADTRRDAGR